MQFTFFEGFGLGALFISVVSYYLTKFFMKKNQSIDEDDFSFVDKALKYTTVQLDEKDFLKLVRGEVVEIKDVNDPSIKIILQDVGYPYMKEVIDKSYYELLKRVPDI